MHGVLKACVRLAVRRQGTHAHNIDPDKRRKRNRKLQAQLQKKHNEEEKSARDVRTTQAKNAKKKDAVNAVLNYTPHASHI
jgi:hypothetical protein